MLYYVGYTDRIGNVDKGSTVTDFLETERRRGITIQSSCIPMGWNKHRINLIDTPGHVDFTFEVERSLRVLDGCVVLLDGVAGAESQTETVWRQTNRYSIPRILFVNKMDRDGAGFHTALASARKRLGGWGLPLPVQLPVFRLKTGEFTTRDNSGGSFWGLVDLVSWELLNWQSHSDGSVVNRTEISDSKLLLEAKEGRELLVEQLSDIDDEIVEMFMKCEGDHLKIPAKDIKASIRKSTISGSAVPLLCGASFKNIGVQPLLDAIIDYLPSPLESIKSEATLEDGKKMLIDSKENNLCALVFKVTKDSTKGLLAYVRVYSGTLETRSTLKVCRHDTKVPSKVRVSKLYDIYADEFEEISKIEAGNIGVIVGMKDVKTGDTILNSADKRYLLLQHIPIPEPVFVRSLEANSLSEEKKLDAALDTLVKEDPSLHVYNNEETGQKLLAGMGELHLEIAGERLSEFLKSKSILGPVDIAYREAIQNDSSLTKYLEFFRNFNGKELRCGIELSLTYIPDPKVTVENFVEVSSIYQDAEMSIPLGSVSLC
jgi:elongation factor G